MIHFTDCQEHPPRAFEQYLAMGGYSHSFLKYSVNGLMPYKETTDKMRFGSLVDAIMTNQMADIAHPQYHASKVVASYLLAKFPYLVNCKKQIPCTGIAHYNSFTLPMRTLIDFVMPGVATIELKMTDARTEKSIETLIDYMGYENQLYIERSLACVPKSYILVYSNTTNKIYFRERECPNAPAWLASKIMEFGTLKTQ